MLSVRFHDIAFLASLGSKGIFDTFDEYADGAELQGLTLGRGWSTPWADQISYAGVFTWETFDTYIADEPLQGLDDGDGWATLGQGTWTDANGYLGILVSDMLDEYPEGTLNNADGGEGWGGTWVDADNSLEISHDDFEGYEFTPLIFTFDDFESYGNDVFLQGLNGGTNFAGTWAGTNTA